MFRRWCTAGFLWVAIALLAATTARAQFDLSWARTYNTPGSTDDRSRRICADDSGYVYVVGTATHPTRAEDILFLRYDHGGVLVDAWGLNGPADSTDYAAGMVVDDSGHAYIVGRTYSGPPTGWDYLLIKTDPAGGTIWTRQIDFGFDNVDYGREVKLTANGNILVLGESWDGFALSVGLTEYTPGGSPVWRQTHHHSTSQVDDGIALTCDGAGQIYVCGSTTIAGNTSILTLKLDSGGDTIWTRVYDGTAAGYDSPVGIVVDSGRNVYVAGSSEGTGTYSDIIVLKYDSLGGLLWTRRVNGTADTADFAQDITLAANGNVYVAGTMLQAGTYFDAVVVKCVPSDGTGGANTYPSQGLGYDDFIGVATDQASYAYATGAAVPQGYGGNHLNIRQFNPASMGEEWGTFYVEDSGSSYGYDICVDAAGNVYVTGVAYGGASTAFDIVTLKYTPTSAAVFEPNSGEPPRSFTLSQNFPNPFNAATTISFDLEFGGTAALSIHNVLGQLIQSHVENDLMPGSYSFTWDGRDSRGRPVPSGLYLYTLATYRETQTKKMILLK